ncbi:MAG: spore cortex biosynthesis protein YabQ [Clostridia bacterium]|nr:spore cortex biosynthesis protein YabQ [Clostridia bacterium]
MPMEWSGKQQLLFLLQSAGLGVGIGLLFDSMTGMGRACKRRAAVFFIDVMFGIVAGFITFFAALAIMDGALHPLLFLGGGVGFLAEHNSVGVICSRWVCAALRGLGLFYRRFCEKFEAVLLLAGRKMAHFFTQMRKIAKKGEKNPKKFRFFQKKT